MPDEMHETPKLKTWAEMAAERGFGMCNTGQWLGVMVGPSEAAVNCPAGWCFVETHEDKALLAVQIQDAIDYMRSCGRSSFPKKVTLSKKGELEESDVA